jgi:hypothetical protein
MDADRVLRSLRSLRLTYRSHPVLFVPSLQTPEALTESLIESRTESLTESRTERRTARTSTVSNGEWHQIFFFGDGLPAAANN